MATSSQYVAAKDALLALIRAAITANAATLTSAGLVGVEAFYAWPGPDTPPDVIFLGRRPEDGRPPSMTSQIPTIKAGTKQRQQEFDIPVTCESWRPDLSPDAARTAEVGGQALLDIVDGVCAASSRLNEVGIQVAELRDIEPNLAPINSNSGWLSSFVPTIHVRTRLT